MKKLQQILAACALVVLPVMAATTASALGTCDVGFTGPNSNNVCTSTTTNTCEVVNDNTVTVNNANGQVADTGNANGSVNTTGGGAQTGSATNSNGTTFSVAVTNGSCTVVTTVPAKSSPTPKPSGSGSVKQAVPAPVQKVAPAMLANTSGSTTTQQVIELLSATVLGLIALRIAILAYSRRHI